MTFRRSSSLCSSIGTRGLQMYSVSYDFSGFPWVLGTGAQVFMLIYDKYIIHWVEVSVSLVCDYDFFFNFGPDKFCMTQLDFCWFQNLIPGESLFSHLYCGVYLRACPRVVCVCVCVHMHIRYDSSIVILYSHMIHFSMSLFGQLLEYNLNFPPSQLFVEEWGPRREIYSWYLIACYTWDCWHRSNCPKNSWAPDTGQRDVWNGVPKINVT